MPTPNQRPGPSRLAGDLIHRIAALIVMAIAGFGSILQANMAYGSLPNIVLVLADDK